MTRLETTRASPLLLVAVLLDGTRFERMASGALWAGDLALAIAAAVVFVTPGAPVTGDGGLLQRPSDDTDSEPQLSFNEFGSSGSSSENQNGSAVPIVSVSYKRAVF